MGVALCNDRSRCYQAHSVSAMCWINYRLNRLRQRVNGVWIKKFRRIGIDLAMNGNIGCNDRTAAFHGFHS